MSQNNMYFIIKPPVLEEQNLPLSV